MLEKIGHIKNPLTVIAIFAGIAEISGTIILPFISSGNQSIYIWFLMLFPFFLVAIFFVTLNFNPTALYSPSDYKDENNFVNSVRKATPEELRTKLHREFEEVGAAIERTESNVVDTSQAVENKSAVDQEVKSEEPKNLSQLSLTRVISDLALAEKLAVKKLSNDLNIGFEKDVNVKISGLKNITFDGFAVTGGTAHAVEVKFFPGSKIDVSRFHSSMIEASYAALNLNSIKVNDFIFHLFIVANVTPAQKHKAKADLLGFANSIGLRVMVHFAGLNDMVNEYQYG